MFCVIALAPQFVDLNDSIGTTAAGVISSTIRRTESMTQIDPILSRRGFLFLATSVCAAETKLSSKERVDKAVRGDSVDRPPFTLWHHFDLESKGPEAHAEATIRFHRKFRTDLVKVMSDFPYPKPQGEWTTLKVLDNPFPAQIRALELIRAGVGKDAYFVETIFNPWTVAEKLSSKEKVLELKQTKPQLLLDALDVIARSEANHAKRAIAAGASGIFLAIANAQPEILKPQEYAKFSEPFDRIVLDAVRSAPHNTLHLHGEHVYLYHFTKPWPAVAINYSAQGTGVSVEQFRKKYSGVIISGLDERSYKTLTPEQMKSQWQAAQSGAGKRFILAPGCSVPNDSTDAELNRLPALLGA
jgi:uroporphyrinogen decarboxylase